KRLLIAWPAVRIRPGEPLSKTKPLFLFTFSGDQTNLDALLEPLSAAFYNSKILCQDFLSVSRSHGAIK
ncbi:MAG: hypothetical protein ACO20X_14760, partial [Alphaproteobacteria bacterium]